MEPTIPVGSLVIATPAPDVKVGDVILFPGNHGTLTVHRYIGDADDGSVQTQGDANATPDIHEHPLQKSEVMGKVVMQMTLLSPSVWMSIRGLVIALMIIVIIACCIMWPKSDGEDLSKNPKVEDHALTH